MQNGYGKSIAPFATGEEIKSELWYFWILCENVFMNSLYNKKWKEFLSREIAYAFIYVYVAEIFYLKTPPTDSEFEEDGALWLTELDEPK